MNAVDNEQHSALHWAIVCGELEALDLLHKAGANPSIPDNHGALPIHYAVQMCSAGSANREKQMICQLGLQRLLSMGVDIRVRDREGRDPLLWAASAGSVHAIRALVQEGASVASQDRDGLSGLHCAASRGHADTIMCLVKECGANPGALDSNGCSPLFYSVTLGHRECTEALLSLGKRGLADVKDRKERTAAHCGAARGRLESLKVLERTGADLWVPNCRGDLPLHESIQCGNRELVSWLLSLRPSSINVANNDGRTILHIAALNNDIEMCKMLIDHGAFVNPIMRNAKGQLVSPVDGALHRGNRGTAKYLQLHGGVPASKITDKAALQKALTKAITESQFAPAAMLQPNDAEGQSKVRFSESVSQIPLAPSSKVEEKKPGGTAVSLVETGCQVGCICPNIVIVQCTCHQHR